MPNFKNLFESALGGWNESTAAARFGLILLILLCVGMISFVGYWSSQPTFVPLISDGDTSKVYSVVDALDKAGIAYELGGAGGVVRVDKRKYSRAARVAKDLGIATDQSSSSSGPGGMWLDPTDRKHVELRMRESKLKATIGTFAAVSGAEIHLNVPVKGPFERKIAKPSASVVLTLVPGHHLNDENVLAIAYTVAYAIEDLEPESVRIMDKNGNVYNVPDEMAGNMNNQIDFVAQFEKRLARKAEMQLSRFFGMENASVQISLDMTFVQKEITKHDFDPDRKVAKTEDITTKSTTKEAPSLGAGVNANLTSRGAPKKKAELKDKTEELTATYEFPTTDSTETDNTPKRTFMTVSVLVNANSPGVQSDDGSLSPDIKNRVEQIVKTAVGFKEGVDQIWVEFPAFPELAAAGDEAVPFDWAPINEILKTVSLAVAALVALAIGFLTLRHFNRLSKNTSPVQVPNQQASNVNQLNDLARTNPEVFANILKSWAGDRDKAPTAETDPAKQNAA